MNELLIGLVSAALATNQPAAVSNLVLKQTGVSVEVANPNDPVEKEYQALMKQDDDAQAEVDKWIRENDGFAKQGAGVPRAELNRRIREKFEPVKNAYEDFIAAHPRHAKVRVVFASFLEDTGDEEGALDQLEKAKELDAKNPAVWNNLANHHGHIGAVKKAFGYYAKAIELKPDEPVYYHNFGTTVYLFRKDAMEFYGISEQQVFDKAMALYSNSMRLDPKNFLLAHDFAQTYYGIRPLRTNDALAAWTNAFQLAGSDLEREGLQLHLARVKWLAGRFGESRAHLNLVTNETYDVLKKRILKNLDEAELKVTVTVSNLETAPVETNKTPDTVPPPEKK